MGKHIGYVNVIAETLKLLPETSYAPATLLVADVIKRNAEEKAREYME